MEDNEKWPTLTKLVEQSHDIWEKMDAVSFVQLLPNLNAFQQLSMCCAKLNYQVENGGFEQWLDNGYGKGEAGQQLLRHLILIDSKNVEAVSLLVSNFFDLCESMGYEHIGHEEYADFAHEVDKLDKQYYEIKEDFLREVESFLSART